MTDLLRFFNELVRLEIELWDAVDARLRKDHDLPLSRYEPLKVIDGRRQCRVHDIAADLAITVGGTSKLVDRIEASGLCRRLPNPDDGRSSLIELTDLGRQVLAAATRTASDELGARIGAALPDGAARQLIASLAGLRDANRSTPAITKAQLITATSAGPPNSHRGEPSNA